MTVPTTSLPSLGQWRLINLLAIRAAFTADRRASQMMNRIDCNPSDLGELAEEGWITGHNALGEDVDLAENWNHSLAHIYLRLARKGRAWATGNPHNRLLFEIADAQGAYRMKPGEVKEHDEVLRQLVDRRLISIETEDGRDPTVLTLAHRLPEEMLYVRLTEQGRRVVSP